MHLYSLKSVAHDIIIEVKLNYELQIVHISHTALLVSLKKSVFSRDYSLSDIAIFKHFYTLRSTFKGIDINNS